MLGRGEAILSDLYRWMSRILPRSLRQSHGLDMEQAFRDGLLDTRAASSRRIAYVTRSLVSLILVGVSARLQESKGERGKKALERSISSGSPGGGERMGQLWQDLRLAMRSSIRRPGFSLSVISISALGLGATTTIFSVLDGVVLRGLTYPDADALVFFEDGAHTIPRFRDWQERVQSFETLSAAWAEDYSLTGSGNPERLSGVMTSEGFLPTLGGQAVLGRLFVSADFRGPANVAVLSQGLWERRFGADPDILGKGITLNEEPRVVIGVLGRDFAEPVGLLEAGTDVWLPLDITHPEIQSSRMFVLNVIAKLRNDTSLPAARGELRRLAPEFSAANPEVHGTVDPDDPTPIPIVPLQDAIVGDVQSTLFLLLGAVSVMLLIACANVANLFLARGADYDRDVAVRRALGAGRGRVVSQLLCESTLLSVVGGVVGTGLAYVAVASFRALGPRSFPRIAELTVDERVLAVAFTVSLMTGIVFGLAPAWKGAQADINQIIKDGSPGASGKHRTSLRGLLVISEISLTLVLLSGAGLLAKSFLRLNAVDPGFETQQLLMVPLNLAQQSGEERLNFVEQLRERLTAVRGVESASVALNAPFVRFGNSRCCWASFSTRSDTGVELDGFTLQDWVTPDFFETLGVPVRGRALRPQDRDAFPIPTVVSGALANELYGDEEPIGRTFTNEDEEEFLVVGTVTGLHYYGLDQGTDKHIWILHDPFANTGGTGSMVLLVRSDRELGQLSQSLRETIWSIAPDLPVDDVMTMQQRISASTARPRFQSLLFLTFAAVALLIAAAGVYGSTLYVVFQRQREFGIRMALGARRLDVMSMVLVRGALYAVAGVLIGLVAARAVSGFLESLLFGVTPTDPVTMSAVGVILTAVTLVACWVPARRATTANPVETLRSE